MKTHTSKRTRLFKALLVLPVLALLIYGFSTKETIEISNNKDSQTLTKIAVSENILEFTILENDAISFKNKQYSFTNFKETINPKEYTKSSLTLSQGVSETFVADVIQFLQSVNLSSKLTVCQSTDGKTPAIDSGKIMRDIFKTKADKEIVNKETNTNQKGQDKKLFVLQIEISKLRFNGREVALKDLAKTIDNYTKDWEVTDYTSVRPNILIASTPKSFLDKVDVEFRKTNFSKANGGMDIVPPPPPPPPAPKAKKGEKSNIPPPPPPPAPMMKKGEKSNIPSPPRVATPEQHYETVASIKVMKKRDSKGYLMINGTTHYYTKTGDKISYFDRFGVEVNEKGEVIKK